MIDNQADIIKKIFAKNRVKVKDVLKALFPQGKGSYYNAIKRNPLDGWFIEGVLVRFGIDLVKELKEHSIDLKAKNDQLEREISELRKELAEARKETLEIIKKYQ